MKYLNAIQRLYLAQAGEGDLPGGGGDGGTTTDAPRMYTQAEVDELTAGLKGNNEKLLSEKKEAAARTKAENEARIKAEQEAARKSGELEAFEKSLRSQYEPQLAERDTRYGKLAERYIGSERKAALGQFTPFLVDPEAADIIGMLIEVELDGDDVVTKYKGADGKVLTTDPAVFRDYLCKHKAFSHLIKADAPSGGGAGGNKRPGNGVPGVDPTLTGIDKTRAEVQARLAKKYAK